jgi:glutathione S-transferase
MATLEIIGIPQSTYVRVVRMVCEEKGVAYELAPAAPHSPPVAAIHPFGKVPVMRHGDLELCESKAIATYIDRSFGGPKMIPDDPRAAAAVEQWVSLVNTTIDPVMIRTYLLNYIFPKGADGKPDRAVIDGVVPMLQKQMAMLDGAVAKTGHLAGANFTLADINLLPILFYVRQFPEGAAAFAAAKNVDAYYARHASRPSFQKTMPPPPPPTQSRAPWRCRDEFDRPLVPPAIAAQGA